MVTGVQTCALPIYVPLPSATPLLFVQQGVKERSRGKGAQQTRAHAEARQTGRAATDHQRHERTRHEDRIHRTRDHGRADGRESRLVVPRCFLCPPHPCICFTGQTLSASFQVEKLQTSMRLYLTIKAYFAMRLYFMRCG